MFFPSHCFPKGGILADEMGLGKTVEVLALILAHRWAGTESGPDKSNSHDDSKSDSRAEPGGSVNNSMAAVADESMLCLCGAIESKPGDHLVQCERCFKWQHVHCVKFSEEHGDTFVCVKCLLKEVRLTKVLACSDTVLCPDPLYSYPDHLYSVLTFVLL